MYILTTQGVGELADLPVQLTVGDMPALGRIVAFPDDRYFITARLQMTVQAVGRHVQRAISEPFDIHMMVVEGGLFDAGEGPDPVQTRRLFAPESFRVDHRLLIQGLVLGLVGQRPRRHFGPHGV
jgi:hypothetical protein